MAIRASDTENRYNEKINLYTERPTNPVKEERLTTQTPQELEVSEEGLLKSLEALNTKEQELVAMQENIQRSLCEIKEQKTKIETQLAQKKAPSAVENPQINLLESVNAVSKIAQLAGLAKPVLIVNTTQIIKSNDGSGEREHYSVSLISKENEEIPVAKFPIDFKKYGVIEHIVIFDGATSTPLKIESLSIQRLIKFLSTDFDKLRKEMNADKVDVNGYYSNKYQSFDCQRFSYYLQYGTEKTYAPKYYNNTREINFRETSHHRPDSFYSMSAETASYGSNGSYSGNDLSVHHYMCLTPHVYVSKYGNTDILFTSYNHILDAYFPKKFIKGNLFEETY